VPQTGLNPEFPVNAHACDFLTRRFCFTVAFLCWTGAAYAQQPATKCAPPQALSEQLASHPTAAAYDALGRYYGDQRKFGCAASAFRSSLKLDPNSAQTHYYLALALLAEGDAQDAILEFRRSVTLQPNQPEARLALGAALSQINDVDAAAQEFQEVLKTDPKSITAIDWLAKAYISQKRYPAAIALLKDAPSDEVLQMDLVVAYSSFGDNDRALQLLAQMEHDRPDSAVPHSGVAKIYIQQRRYEDAAKEFQEALRLNSHDDASRASYIRTLLLLSKFDDALPLAQEYQRTRPNDFDACYLLGVVDRDLGDYANAKTLLSAAVKINPQHYAARYNLGLVYAKSGEHAAARKQLERAVQLDPTSADAHFQLAAALRSLSLQDAARTQLAVYQNLMAERAEKDVAAAKANQAKEFLERGDAQKAAELYRQSAEKDPKNSHLLYDLALALDRAGDPVGEQRALERAVELDPGFAAARNQLGFLLLQAGHTADGEKQFRTAISLDPHYAEAQNNLGVLYGQQGKDVEAERLFQAAIESDPGYAPSYVNLAAALASQSRFAEAESMLRKALQIEPDNPDTRAFFAQIESQLGRPGNVHP
jgi:tetratricopeptide (TPR) repeat protein